MSQEPREGNHKNQFSVQWHFDDKNEFRVYENLSRLILSVGLKNRMQVQPLHFQVSRIPRQDLNLEPFFLRIDAFHNHKAHSTLWDDIFHCESFLHSRSIEFLLSHDFNCICSFPLLSALQQSTVLMQMTTFYLCTIDFECFTRRRGTTECDKIFNGFMCWCWCVTKSLICFPPFID